MRLSLRTIACLAAAGALAGCDDGTGVQEPEIVALEVSGVRLDASTFDATRRFELGLLATDENGDAILSDEVKVTAVVTAIEPAGAMPALALLEMRVQEPGTKPIAAAIDIDDSGSMGWSDEQNLRGPAAQIFWESVLTGGPQNEVAFFDFGHDYTDGFTDSRLLQPWTRDATLLQAQLAQVEPYGGTPLYESMLEVVTFVDTSRAAAQWTRTMLLLTDGEPNGFELRDQAIAAATAAGIVVNTVGLGAASDLDPEHSDDAVAVVREIAERTGGVYAAATDAAALAKIFSTLAQVTAKGQIIAAFALGAAVPPGTRITGTVTVESGGATATATWSFVTPGGAPASFRKSDGRW